MASRATAQVDQLASVATTPGNDALARTRVAYGLTTDVYNAGKQLSGQALGSGGEEQARAMALVDAIKAVPTTRHPGHENVPVDDVVIESIRLLP